MNYDPSEVKKLREQHALLQAQCAALQGEMLAVLKAHERELELFRRAHLDRELEWKQVWRTERDALQAEVARLTGVLNRIIYTANSYTLGTRRDDLRERLKECACEASNALYKSPVQTQSEGPMDNGIRAILPKDCELCSKPLHWCSRCGELQTACGWTLCDECRYLDDPRMSPVQLSPTPTQSEDKK